MIPILFPEQVIWIIRTLEQQGYETYAVGGCVRDSLLGKTPTDWDLCTAALPEKVLECFPGYAIPTGLQHGTVIVVLNGFSCEITTFRTEGPYSDRRRPDWVQFTPNLKEDLSRRDFTVNAMAFHPEKGLFDPFEGEKDLKAGMIRCVGEANRRFEEDALRVLRALRFAAVLDFELEEKTEQAMKEKQDGLKAVSAERIMQEMRKLLSAPKGAQILKKYPKLVGTALPEIKALTDSYDLWNTAMEELTSVPERFLLRLCLLLSHLPIDAAEKAVRSMRLERQEQSLILQTLRLLEASVPDSSGKIKRMLYRFGIEPVRNAAILWKAKGLEKANWFKNETERILQSGECIDLSMLAVCGKDLIALGMQPGEEIGKALEFLLFQVMDGSLQNEKQTLLNALF